MKKFISLLIIITLLVCTYAQNTFFPTQAGIIQTYVSKDAKGKIDNYSRQTIQDVQTLGNETTVLYLFESLDKKQKSADPPATFPCKVTIKDGVVFLNMNEMFALMQNDAQLNAMMEVSGVPMEISGNLQPGESLKDADMNMTIDLGLMKMKHIIKMTDGKCLAIEDLTVPAGTFKCHKITQTCTTMVMKKKVTSTTVSWYALGIGTVKAESYDDKNKLQNSMELVQLIKP